MKVPEPKLLGGTRDTKAFENFISDLKQYFRAINTVVEETKVTLATMHVAEDAKLCWGSKYMDPTPTVIQTNTHQPKVVKIMSAIQLRKNIHVETTHATISIVETGSLSELTLTKPCSR